MANFYVITGPAGVGKSTVTKALAERISKCAILEGDEIYHQVFGAVKPWVEGNHVRLMWKNILCLAKNYLEAGIDVIVNYIISKNELENIVQNLKEYEIHFACLMAKKETIVFRDEIRPEEEQMHRVDVHLKKFKEYGFDEKFILSTDDKSPEEEAEEIFSGKFKLD